MKNRLHLNSPRQVTPEDLRQQFHAGLNQTLGPPKLLTFECIHFNWKLRRTHHLRQIDKLPSFKLRAVAEICVFRESVVLPAS